MNSRRRLIFYLLINVFVSALVAGAVIFCYDHFRPIKCSPLVSENATVLPGTGDVNVSVVGVLGAGTLKDEQLIIQNNGKQELELTGWHLTDNKGDTYTFPQLTLFPGGKVQVHTTAGVDTPTDLYWDNFSPVWASGTLAALYDTNNIARAFYRVP